MEPYPSKLIMHFHRKCSLGPLPVDISADCRMVMIFCDDCPLGGWRRCRNSVSHVFITEFSRSAFQPHDPLDCTTTWVSHSSLSLHSSYQSQQSSFGLRRGIALRVFCSFLAILDGNVSWQVASRRVRGLRRCRSGNYIRTVSQGRPRARSYCT